MEERPVERSDSEWMRLHVETLFTRDVTGQLLRVNEAGGAAAPRFLLGHTRDGNRFWSGPALSPELREALSSHPAVTEVTRMNGPNPREAELVKLLGDVATIEHRWSGPTYRFPEVIPSSVACTLVTEDNASVLEEHFKDWMADVGECEPFAVALHEGRAVALCVSVRITDVAHEAGVKTHEDYRGRGMARRATACWAAAVRGAGQVPLYSTSWSNQASQGVAKSLGLIAFGHTFHVT